MGGPVMTVPGKELEDKAAGRQTRDEGVGVLVLRLDGLAARPLPLPQPPDASRPRRQPREVQGAGPSPGKALPEEWPGADAAVVAPAQAWGVRRLVGLVPVICPAVLLITFARGRASIIGISVGGALHAALQASPEVSEDLDGEQAVLH